MKRAWPILLALAVLIVLIATVGTYSAGETWYEELKSWQDGLAAVIALAGLVIVADFGFEGVRSQIKANAREAQRQHDREQISAALSMGATLAGELNAIIKAINIVTTVIDKYYTDKAETHDPIKVSVTLKDAEQSIPRLRFYDSFSDRIGLLGAPMVEQIAHVHTELETFIKILGDWSERVMLADPPTVAHALKTARDKIGILKTLAQTTYDAIKARLSELEAERDAL